MSFFVQVPLGVELLNENKYDEMCAILLSLQRYCPAVKAIDDDTSTEVCHHYPILFDGDQLTVARARGAIRLRENHCNDEQINGFQPVVADWHARMNLVGVCYNVCTLCINTI